MNARKQLPERAVNLIVLVCVAGLCATTGYLLWLHIPSMLARYTLYLLLGMLILAMALWVLFYRRRMHALADSLCDTMDGLMAGREPEAALLYADTLEGEVTGKLAQYYTVMQEGRSESQKDKQVLQEIVSHISHQVKTPLASIKMFGNILRQHQLEATKREEFLTLMEGQINKLDFLMESLVKMSRLETGTFVLHVQNAPVSDTIAAAINGVWAKAEAKDIQLAVECDTAIQAKHDPKWTAEALSNILDNAVKYTPQGGSITITARPWHMYIRIDVADTGIGIPQEHYHDVFSRFYRGPEVAAEEGVGLGLYLAQGITTRQKGYISVKSTLGQGSVFSVYLPN